MLSRYSSIATHTPRLGPPSFGHLCPSRTVDGIFILVQNSDSLLVSQSCGPHGRVAVMMVPTFGEALTQVMLAELHGRLAI